MGAIPGQRCAVSRQLLRAAEDGVRRQNERGQGIAQDAGNAVCGLLCPCCVGGSVCCVGKHLRHKLLVERRGRLLSGAVRRQGRVDVVAAGAGVGRVAGSGGAEHPLAGRPAGQGAADRNGAAAVQQKGRGQTAVAVPDVEGDGQILPCCGQTESEPIHADGVLCAEVELAGAGKEFGSAEVLGGDLNFHKASFFKL